MPADALLSELLGKLSLMVQWLRNLPSNAEDVGLIPNQGTKIPHAAEQLSLGTTKDPCDATKIPLATAKTQCGQINKYFKNSLAYTLSTAHDVKSMCTLYVYYTVV